MKALRWLKKVWSYLSLIKMHWWYEVSDDCAITCTFFLVVGASVPALLSELVLQIVFKPCLCYRSGLVQLYKSMFNFLDQMEFGKVPCLTLLGSVLHNYMAHQMVRHEIVFVNSKIHLSEN